MKEFCHKTNQIFEIHQEFQNDKVSFILGKKISRERPFLENDVSPNGWSVFYSATNKNLEPKDYTSVPLVYPKSLRTMYTNTAYKTFHKMVNDSKFLNYK
jgi:hypothetical protein